jgi:hypothetical protein
MNAMLWLWFHHQLRQRLREYVLRQQLLQAR